MFAVFTYKYQSIYQQMFSISIFLGFQMGTYFLELKLNHCPLLLFVSCCTGSYYIFWEIMGFLKNYVANMGQIAKKLRKSSIYWAAAALNLCSLLVTLQNTITFFYNFQLQYLRNSSVSPSVCYQVVSC